MSSSYRAELLSKLRETASGQSAGRIELERNAMGSGNAPVISAQNPSLTYLQNVLANQGSFTCVANRNEAVQAVGNYLYGHFRSHRLVAGNDPRLAAMPWRDAGVLPRFGSLEEGEPAALSYAKLGIVETGAVVTYTGKGNPCANHLLPEHHLVLVDVNDLVLNLEQAWEVINSDLEKGGRPRGINMIAGPSSTADIEGQLVYGAHGPRRWHVILLGEVPAVTREMAEKNALAY